MTPIKRTRWLVHIVPAFVEGSMQVNGHADIDSRLDDDAAKIEAINTVSKKSNLWRGEYKAWALPLREGDAEAVLVKSEVKVERRNQ